MATQVLDQAAIEQVASEIPLDMDQISLVPGPRRVNYSEVIERAHQLDISPTELHGLALRVAVADGSDAASATSANYRDALAFLNRLREDDKTQCDIEGLLHLLEADD